jgi:hypothetical protein
VTHPPGSFDELSRRATAAGLAVRGAFHPEPHEFDGVLPQSVLAGTLVLLGFTGSLQWPIYARSAEARDGRPHPLDRWSRRVIGSLARQWGAVDFYPNGTPRMPFQRLAARCEPVHPSPLGLLIHPQWGLWHAYRGALLLRKRIDLPVVATSASPCSTCTSQPCRSTCPVGAFNPGGFDVGACVDHVRSPSGSDCRDHGCRARRACPVGTEFGYRPDQARFHMAAFLHAVERSEDRPLAAGP